MLGMHIQESTSALGNGAMPFIIYEMAIMTDIVAMPIMVINEPIHSYFQERTKPNHAKKKMVNKKMFLVLIGVEGPCDSKLSPTNIKRIKPAISMASIRAIQRVMIIILADFFIF